MFVDFMYAIVVGSALPLLTSERLNLLDVHFWGILFLLVVILEDYYLYETRIAPFQQPGKVSPVALFFELAILVSWYLSAVAVSAKENRTIWFLCAFGAFFLLKFLAGVAHWVGFYRSLSGRKLYSLWRGTWESIVTNFAFGISILIALVIAWQFGQAQMRWWMLLALFIAWLLTLITWWTSYGRMTLNIETLARLPDGTVGQAYGPATLTATRAAPPYTWKLIGNGVLPPGLELDARGQITGTPTGPAQVQFTLEVSDAASKTASRQFTIVVP